MAICPAIFAAIFFVSCADQGVGAPLGEPMSIEVFAGGKTAGYADGEGQAARFDELYGIDVAPNGTIYVADQNNQRIRKITATGLVSTLAGSGMQTFVDKQQGAAASFNNPKGIAVAADGTIYVADQSNNRIRKITPAGFVSTLVNINDSKPQAIAVGPDGLLYVTNSGRDRVEKITLDGTVSHLSADFAFSTPRGIAVAADGTVYVGTESNIIYKFTPGPTPIIFAGPDFSVVNMRAGSADGQGAAARFARDQPQGVTVGPDGNIYVADGPNGIRKITPTGLVSTLIKEINARDIAFSPDGSTAYITEPTRILKLRFR